MSNVSPFMVNCVSLLESWLERAKRGEIVHVAVASVDADNGVTNAFAIDSTKGSLLLLSAIDVLKKRVLEEVT